MRIGILGSGDVGRKLGDGLIELGHSIKIGSRDPNKRDIVQWINNHGGEESKEPDYNEDNDQLEEKQEEETRELNENETTVF